MSEQRKIIHDDNNGLDYVLVGDYYMPMLALPEENRPIGYRGILRKQYLKKHKSGMYSYLLLTGKLDRYLADLNEQAQERYVVVEEHEVSHNKDSGAEANLSRTEKTDKDGFMEVPDGELPFD